MKGIDDNKVSLSTLKNLKGTLDNRVREIYRQAYKEGFEDGKESVTRTKMSDCISRQAAIEALGEEPDIAQDTEEEWAERDMWVRHIRAIELLPSVEPKRPKGEWIRISNDWIDGACGARYFPIRCSVCDYSTYDDNATKFCPNCGADMRGE